MRLSCGLFRRRRKPTTEDPPRRVRTMSIFGNSNIHAIQTLHKMVGLSVFATTTSKGWQKSDQSSTDSSTLSTGPELPIPMSTEMNEALRRLYNELRGRHAKLPKARFLKFLSDVQGEGSVELNKDEYDFGDFLFAWVSDSSDAIASLPAKDLSKPLTNYFINSSHNTYLEGNQLASRSSPNAYRTALLRGCRCIEIDVWNGDTVVPTSRSNTPKGDHRPRLSGSSFPNAANTTRDLIDDTYESFQNYLNEKTVSRSRSASGASRTDDEPSPRSSAQFSTEPKDSFDRLGVPRSPRSRSRQSFTKGEPIVTHGWTFTTPCSFREVCKTIRETAFVDNDLPIIVSLEVHADQEQQEVMVRIMKEEWQGLLLDRELDGCDARFQVPELGQVLNKILVKVKKAPAHVVVPPTTLDLPVICARDEDASDASDSEDEEPPQQTCSRPDGPAPPHSKNLKVPICPNLGKLAIYTRSQHYRSLETPEAKKPPHIFSISENRILELNHKHHRAMFMHNKRYFMRAFPAGRRIDSSNPDPSLFWRGGVQMVAMNWQKYDEGMMLNEGMFADEKGWVLKPAGYRGSDKLAESQLEAAPGRLMDLCITFFAGHHIPVHAADDMDNSRSASSIRPLIKAELHVDKPGEAERDGPTHECKYKEKTHSSRTDHPDFGATGAVVKFANIPRVVEQLSFIRIKVEDDSTGLVSSPLLAWACIRLDRLRSGYRFIKLMDSRGNPVQGGKLLVKIEKAFR